MIVPKTLTSQYASLAKDGIAKMNWYKESTSKFDILTRTVSSFFLKKIKEHISKRDEIASLRGEAVAKKIFNKKYHTITYRQNYINFNGIETKLVVEMSLLIGEDDFFNDEGLFEGLKGTDFLIKMTVNIPYFMLNMQDLGSIKESITVTIRHELEHLKEYIETKGGLEGTALSGEDIDLQYLFNPSELRATAMSLKMLAERTRNKNQPPNYEDMVDRYVSDYAWGWFQKIAENIAEKTGRPYTEVSAEMEAKESQYRQELINLINVV